MLRDQPAPITIQDGVEALRIAIAATRACETGTKCQVTSFKVQQL